MPDEFRAFDYDTISDVIFHVRYTARDGGRALRDEAVNNVKARMSEAAAAGMVRLFSVRHEFPSEWAKFLNQTPAANQRYALTLDFRKEHYPY